MGILQLSCHSNNKQHRRNLGFRFGELKLTRIGLPFVAVSCRVGKQMIWRTTAKEKTSMLQNIQNKKLIVHACMHFASS